MSKNFLEPVKPGDPTETVYIELVDWMKEECFGKRVAIRPFGKAPYRINMVMKALNQFLHPLLEHPTDREIMAFCTEIKTPAAMLLTRKMVKEVECPECGAKPGEHCNNDNDANHIDRVFDAIRINWDYILASRK